MNNVAVGYQAALCTTTGDQNTAIGSCALRLNTTAANNTAVGFRVLLSNTTGTNNTAVGSNALCANVEGDQSVAARPRCPPQPKPSRQCRHEQRGRWLSGSALATTTGVNNTAVGACALFANTTGNTNTGVGFQSLYANTTGVNNAALGSPCFASMQHRLETIIRASGYAHDALCSNTTGSSNT
jgi:trimeric autotransporter adhesin